MFSIIIAGPTACGKTALAINLAKHFGAEIINADSLQLYKNIPVLSACPTEKEIMQAPHHLFRIYENYEKSTAKKWCDLASNVNEKLLKKQRPSIFVGGTGLYLKALTLGLSPIPEISAETRQRVAEIFQKTLKANFYHEVCKFDNSISKVLHPNDHYRLKRALEVFIQTGKSIMSFKIQGDTKAENQAEKQGQGILKNYLYFKILPNRESLYLKINKRAETMLEEGAIEEVKALRDSGITLQDPVAKAVGIKPIWKYLDKEIEKSELLTLLQQATRQYAKRQYTWFRHQVPYAITLECSSDTGTIVELVKQKFPHLALA